MQVCLRYLYIPAGERGAASSDLIARSTGSTSIDTFSHFLSALERTGATDFEISNVFQYSVCVDKGMGFTREYEYAPLQSG